MRSRIALLAIAGLVCHSAHASFHLWHIEEVFSDAVGRVQFIELGGAPANFENFLTGHVLSSNSQMFEIPTDLPGTDTAAKRVLFGTQPFADLSGAPAPDYIIPEQFFSPAGDSINFANISVLSFSENELPRDGLNALLANMSTAINSPTNFGGETGSVRIEGSDPVAVPLPPAAYPGLAVLMAFIVTQIKSRKAA